MNSWCILSRQKRIDPSLKPIRPGVFPSVNPVRVSGDILRLCFFVQRDADGEEPVGGELRSDYGGGTLVGVEFKDIEEGFYMCQWECHTYGRKNEGSNLPSTSSRLVFHCA